MGVENRSQLAHLSWSIVAPLGNRTHHTDEECRVYKLGADDAFRGRTCEGHVAVAGRPESRLINPPGTIESQCQKRRIIVYTFPNSNRWA